MSLACSICVSPMFVPQDKFFFVFLRFTWNGLSASGARVNLVFNFFLLTLFLKFPSCMCMIFFYYFSYCRILPSRVSCAGGHGSASSLH